MRLHHRVFDRVKYEGVWCFPAAWKGCQTLNIYLGQPFAAQITGWQSERTPRRWEPGPHTLPWGGERTCIPDPLLCLAAIVYSTSTSTYVQQTIRHWSFSITALKISKNSPSTPARFRNWSTDINPAVEGITPPSEMDSILHLWNSLERDYGFWKSKHTHKSTGYSILSCGPNLYCHPAMD